uniref:WGS project CAEQ00000000 data, annotated contig 1326 n=1 Tax=Trypanosoma congolense (strain IL3000) TaxID=1068625 RepID=F9W5H4_TRYCI|nr:unnamed protein product [Trypanosoma congolense IL3000]
MQTTSTEAPRSTASFVDKLHEATHHLAPSPSSSIRNFVGKVPPASTSVVTQGSQSVVRGETQEESAHTGSSNTVAPHCDDALHDPSYGSFSVTHKKQGVGPKSSGTPGLPPFSEHSMANTSDSQGFDAGLPAVTCSAAIKSGSDAQGNDVIFDNKRNIGTPTSEISESIPMFLNMTKGSKCNSVLLSGSASVCRGIASEKGDIAITCSPKDAFETLIAKVDSFVGSSKENKTVSSLNATSVSSTPSVGGDSDQRHSDSSLYSSLSSRRLSGTRSGFY